MYAKLGMIVHAQATQGEANGVTITQLLEEISKHVTSQCIHNKIQLVISQARSRKRVEIRKRGRCETTCRGEVRRAVWRVRLCAVVVYCVGKGGAIFPIVCINTKSVFI